VWVDQIFKEFRGGFVGRPAGAFFWGSFDLAVTRFPGGQRRTPGADSITREAYSHEVSSAGFWPGGGDSRTGLLFVCRAGTVGFAEQHVGPPEAFYTRK